MMAICWVRRVEPAVAAAFRESLVVTDFHWSPDPTRKRSTTLRRLDLGGVRLRVLHTPGHARDTRASVDDWDGSTDRLVYLRGHRLDELRPCLRRRVVDLEDFERSLETRARFDVRWCA